MRRLFKYNKDGYTDKLSATEYFIQDYTEKHIEDYINQFINLLRKTPKVNVKKEDEGNMFAMTKFVTHGTSWETKKSLYYKWLGQNELSPTPQLKQLAKTPLLLTLIMLILPGVANRLKSNEIEMIRICSSETQLYDEFLLQWFSFQVRKIKKPKNNEFLKVLDYLPAMFRMYAQNLAIYILEKSKGYLTENYQLTESETLQSKLLEPYHDKQLRELMEKNVIFQNIANSEESIKILRNGCPLNFYHKTNSPREGLRCRFIHISLIEFLISRDVFDNVRGEFLNLNYYFEIIKKNCVCN